MFGISKTIKYVRCEGSHQKALSNAIQSDNYHGNLGTCSVCGILFRSVNGIVLAHGRPKGMTKDIDALGGTP